MKNAEGIALAYQVTKDNTKPVVQSGDTVLEVSAGSGRTELTFNLTGPVTYSGTYTDTVTFTVSVDKTTH